jgi:integrase
MGIFKRGCDNKGPNQTCSKCGEKGSCGVYWYKFQWNGVPIVHSTKQRNDKVARQMESAHRTSLAKGEVGIRDKKPIPTLAEFIDRRFEPWIKTETKLKTSRDFYGVALKAIKRYGPLAKAKLNEITSELAAEFATHRQNNGGNELATSTVNASIRVLRRVLRVAADWEIIDRVPKIKTKPGENHREHVVTKEEEIAYLTAARRCNGRTGCEPCPTLLFDVVTVLINTGLRPEECNRMTWDWINWDNGSNGTFVVNCGKTKAARRQLFMTAPVREILERRWIAAGKPVQGWVWAAPTKSGHIEPSALKKQHRKALELSKVRAFVLYSLRHTYLTRLGASCRDPWKLAAIAGWSSIQMSSKYVHPAEESLQIAMEELGRYKTGYKPQKRQSKKKRLDLQTASFQSDKWWAVQDSNLRPPACKAGALTS